MKHIKPNWRADSPDLTRPRWLSNKNQFSLPGEFVNQKKQTDVHGS
jgi:hypothetical protein